MGVGEVVEPQRMDTVGSVGSHVGGRRRNVVTTAGLTATVGVSSTGITRGESAVEGAGGRLEAGAELEEGAVKAPDLNRKRFRHRLDPLPLSGLAPPMAFHSISADKPRPGDSTAGLILSPLCWDGSPQVPAPPGALHPIVKSTVGDPTDGYLMVKRGSSFTASTRSSDGQQIAVESGHLGLDNVASHNAVNVKRVADVPTGSTRDIPIGMTLTPLKQSIAPKLSENSETRDVGSENPGGSVYDLVPRVVPRDPSLPPVMKRPLRAPRPILPADCIAGSGQVEGTPGNRSEGEALQPTVQATEEMAQDGGPLASAAAAAATIYVACVTARHLGEEEVDVRSQESLGLPALQIDMRTLIRALAGLPTSVLDAIARSSIAPSGPMNREESLTRQGTSTSGAVERAPSGNSRQNTRPPQGTPKTRKRRRLQSDSTSGDHVEKESEKETKDDKSKLDPATLRAIRNREAAMRSRQLAKQHMLNLEKRKAELEAKVETLEKQNSRLRSMLDQAPPQNSQRDTNI